MRPIALAWLVLVALGCQGNKPPSPSLGGENSTVGTAGTEVHLAPAEGVLDMRIDSSGAKIKDPCDGTCDLQGTWGHAPIELSALFLQHAGRADAVVATQTGAAGSAAVLGVSDPHNASPALSVRGTQAAARFGGGRVEIAGDGGVLALASTAAADAADTVAVPAGVSIFVVRRVMGTQKNELKLPTGAEGQLLFVADDDDDPMTAGEARIPGGALRMMVFAAGKWRAVAG